MNGNIYDLFLGLLIILPFFAGDLKDVIKIWKCVCVVEIFYEWANASDKYKRTPSSDLEGIYEGVSKKSGI